MKAIFNILLPLLFSVWTSSSLAMEPNWFAVLSDLQLHLKTTSGIQNISDISRIFEEDIQLETFEFVLSHLSPQKRIEHVIINGDLFHQDSVKMLGPLERAELVKALLVYMRNRMDKQIHFNLGDQDEFFDQYTPQSSSLEAFRDLLSSLLKPLESQGIYLIGTDSTAVFDYAIGGIEFEISHSPFVKTREIESQLQRLPVEFQNLSVAPLASALRVIEQMPIRTEQLNDKKIRIFTGNKISLSDSLSRVHATGTLSVNSTLPIEPQSYLLIDHLGNGYIEEALPNLRRVQPLFPSQLACRYAMQLNDI